MPGNITGAINPSFPGGAFNPQFPSLGGRTESFLYRGSGVFYNWVVPPGVTTLLVKLNASTGAGGGRNAMVNELDDGRIEVCD